MAVRAGIGGNILGLSVGGGILGIGIGLGGVGSFVLRLRRGTRKGH
jgi:hypothetical protein